MPEPKPISAIMAQQWSLTDKTQEEQEFILTPEEAEKAINHAVTQLKNHHEYKYRSLLSGVDSEEVNKIDWEAKIDKKEVLRIANSNMIRQREMENSLKRFQEETRLQQESLRKQWSAIQFFKMMKWNCENMWLDEPEKRTLIQNEHTNPLITAICFFLSRDPRFETELGYSFSKGLLLRGKTGLGKTFLLQCVQHNEILPILILSMLDITEKVRASGVFTLPANEMLYLDDVGTEEEKVNYYGTNISWFKNFIELYYFKQPHRFNRLIISTNLSFAKLGEAYGTRAESRMRKMFNVVNVTGDDLRKKNV